MAYATKSVKDTNILFPYPAQRKISPLRMTRRTRDRFCWYETFFMCISFITEYCFYLFYHITGSFVNPHWKNIFHPLSKSIAKAKNRLILQPICHFSNFLKTFLQKLLTRKKNHDIIGELFMSRVCFLSRQKAANSRLERIILTFTKMYFVA